jgi:UDP-glucose 4-epimerase
LVEIFGTGEQKRDLVFVDDVVEALLLAARSKNASGKIYNLGGAEPISLRNLVELMVEINGSGQYKLVPFPEDRKKIDIGDFYSNYEKISEEIGWNPKVLLREGLMRTFVFYRKYGHYYW